MINLWLHFVLIFLFILQSKVSFTHDSGTIYDAVFSPDSKTLAVGTSTGLYLYDYPSIDLKHYETFEDGGVHFIKWAPNGNHLVAAVWREGDIDKNKPVYFVYDMATHTKVSSFEDILRWINYYFDFFDSYGTMQWEHGLGEDIFPITYELSHTNSIATSPDSSEMMLLLKSNKIIVRSFPSGTYKKTLTFGDHILYSVGYAEEPNLCWMGTDNGPVLFFDRPTGGIVREVSGPVNPIFVSARENIAIAESEHDWDYHNEGVFLSLNLYNMENGRKTTSLVENRDFGNFHFRFHVLPEKKEILVFYPNFYSVETYLKRFMYTSSPTVQVAQTSNARIANFDIVEELVLAQPFSPDGKVLLQMDLNNLYAIDTQIGMFYRQILPRISKVEHDELYSP